MKVALLCDTHFGARSDSKTFLAHQQRFFTEVFFPYLVENNIDTVLHLGDVFDRRKFINFNTLQSSKHFFFEPLAARDITMHTILGNHDVFYTTTNEVNSVKLLLSDYSNIHIYENQPVEILFDSTCIMMCPWMTKDTYVPSMEKISNSKADMLLGHLDIKGFEMMKGIVSEHGVDHKQFQRFEQVLSGHYHYPSSHGNIRYLGSQYEMNWSDYGVERGFYVLDCETRDLQLVTNPNRIYHKIEYDDVDLTVDQVATLDVSGLKDCFVKVIVKNRTSPYVYDMFMEKLNSSGAADVKSVEDSLNLSEVGVNVQLDRAEGTQEIMYSYIDDVETNVDKDTLKSFVGQLYHEAVSREERL